MKNSSGLNVVLFGLLLGTVAFYATEWYNKPPVENAPEATVVESLQEPLSPPPVSEPTNPAEKVIKRDLEKRVVTPTEAEEISSKYLAAVKVKEEEERRRDLEARYEFYRFNINQDLLRGSYTVRGYVYKKDDPRLEKVLDEYRAAGWEIGINETATNAGKSLDMTFTRKDK